MIEFDLDDVIWNCSEVVNAGLEEMTGYTIENRKEFYIQLPGYTNKDISQMVHQILMKNMQPLIDGANNMFSKIGDSPIAKMLGMNKQ